MKAYLLGGLAWFAIPFMFSTTLGLAAVALRGDPDMRTLSAADVSAGLPAPAAAAAILGKSGAAALLVVLFLAVTSATSAELIAVSSILTYDVYKVRPSQCLSLSRCTYDSILEVLQPQGHRRPDPAGVPCDGRALRDRHGPARAHLLLHRYLHGLALRAYSTPRSPGIYSHLTNTHVGVHGGCVRIGGCPHRDVRHLEQSKQVGLH